MINSSSGRCENFQAIGALSFLTASTIWAGKPMRATIVEIMAAFFVREVCMRRKWQQVQLRRLRSNAMEVFPARPLSQMFVYSLLRKTCLRLSPVQYVRDSCILSATGTFRDRKCRLFYACSEDEVFLTNNISTRLEEKICAHD